MINEKNESIEYYAVNHSVNGVMVPLCVIDKWNVGGERKRFQIVLRSCHRSFMNFDLGDSCSPARTSSSGQAPRRSQRPAPSWSLCGDPCGLQNNTVTSLNKRATKCSSRWQRHQQKKITMF